MNFNDYLFDLKQNGLNIFLSAKVSDLPEGIYPFDDNQKKKTLCLIGNGGSLLWGRIPDVGITDPVDTFSIQKIKQFSGDVEILFPDDQLILPLQKLCRHFHFSHQSPLGIDISHEFGLWFAIRGVFLTSSDVPLISHTEMQSPCDHCAGKPCLSESEIFNARLKCPVKNEHQYSQEQRQYHQSVALKLKSSV